MLELVWVELGLSIYTFIHTSSSSFLKVVGWFAWLLTYLGTYL